MMKFSMEKILVDTNVFVSLYWEKDPNHSIAFKTFIKQSPHTLFYTNNYLVSEVLTVLLFKTKAREKVRQLGEHFYYSESNVRMFQVSLSWQKRALKIFSQQDKPILSFPDCVFIAQAIVQKIKTIFTFDKNIRKSRYFKNSRLLP